MKNLVLSLMMVAISVTGMAQANSDMLERVLGSVVTVAVYQSEGTKQVLGFRGKSDAAYEQILDLSGAQSSGSGFVIERGGKKYIITNAHVIENASSNIGSLAVFSITRKRYEVRVVGGDNFYDIAVLEFVTPPGPEIGVVKFAAREARLGEQVFAVGNPLGEYPYTVSEGIISAKNRVRGGVTGKFGFLQTTATVIWGNSGGPLFDTKGEVLGINSQIAFANRGTTSIWQPQINFALENNLSQRLVNDILDNNGLVKRAWLGVEVKQTYEYNALMALLGMGWSLTDTLPVLSKLVPNSPAAAALANYVGMPITQVNGVAVRNVQEVLGEFERTKPGQNVSVTFLTTGGARTASFTAGEVGTQNLEALSTFVAQNYGGYTLSKDDGKVVVRSGSGAPQRQGEGTKGGNEDERDRRRREYEQQKSRGKIKDLVLPANKSYYVLAAGLEEENWNSVWRVGKMTDLGASLRFSGLAGYCNLYVIGTDYQGDVERVKINLAGEGKHQTTLWY